ncbi:zinc finger CCCH domain-containing protein 53-like isoform X3 [Tasmannia lanceolata]|uniref:zinc finger CCCH domain-containing protein 53-like isoform X3 n=1 Tax=Tasmannia lanceolata TaxID=3420 RepID=UPI004064240F
MDAYEATRIVFSRIQSLDPENASKIMGLLLIQDHGEKEMIRLAFGPETLLHSLIFKAKKELGLLSSTNPSTPTTPSSSPFISTTRQTQNSSSSRLLGLTIPYSSSSWTTTSLSPSTVFHNDFQTTQDELISPNNSSYPNINGIHMGSSSSASTPSSFYGGDLIDEFQLQDQLSFLNEASSPNPIHPHPIGPKTGSDLFYPDPEGRSPNTNEGMLFPYTANWGANGHRRSCSVADICLGSDSGGGFGWKPCLYFARGYCKNGSSCRFLHGLPDSTADPVVGGAGKFDVVEQCQELLRSKSQRLGSASQLMATSASFPYATAGKCMNFLLQNDTQSELCRAAAALMLGEDSHKFSTRSMRMERNDFSIGGGMINPGSRQIYLTFPADSTFREEDVSNYFSIYGPVQDVRIPYQQKRMFGFVTFVYPETVKLILAKGNPHFVCDARVLVKPYKEKGKIPDKKQQQTERGDFSACTTPTSLDSREAYDLQLGARMFYNSHEALLRRKLEAEADLQQAIELQGRRLMGLQLLDVKKRTLSSPLPSPDPFNHSTIPSDRSSPEALEENCKSPVETIPPSEQHNHEQFGQELSGNDIGIEERPHEEIDFQESLEHNLPDSPFASPTKSIGDSFSEAVESSSSTSSNNLIGSSLFPATSTLDMASFKSCFYQMPRFSSGHGAIGM